MATSKSVLNICPLVKARTTKTEIMDNMKMNNLKPSKLSLCTLVMTFASSSCQAVNYFDIAVDPYFEFKKFSVLSPEDSDTTVAPYYKDVLAQTNVTYDITAETTGLIGENIDLNSGSVSFGQTDITIPGNSKLLPITVRRVFSDANFKQKATAEFSDWSLDLPSIHTTVLMPNTQHAGSWGKGLECSGVQRPPAVNYKGQAIDAPQYWNGTALIIGGSQKHLLYRGTADTTYTTKDHWKATCYKKADGSGEGYKVQAPNGLTYMFDIPHAVRNFTLSEDQRALPIYHLYLRVSQITDPYGNWVRYKYDSYTNINNKISQRLTKIEGNDGRLVTFKYDPDANRAHLISSISSAGQTWNYQYSTDLLPSLEKTILPRDPQKPDTSLFWSYNLKQLTLWHNPLFHLDFNEMQRTCEKKSMNVTGYVTHPNGAKAEFTLAPVLHGRTQIDRSMDNGSIDKDSRCYLSLGVQNKTLTGPGLVPMQWNYQYSQNKGAYKGDLAEAAAVQLTDYDSRDLKTTTVSAPDGSKTISVFYRGWNYKEGEQVGNIYLDTDGRTEIKRQWSSFEPAKAQVGQPLINTEFSANSDTLSVPAWKKSAVVQLSSGSIQQYKTEFSEYNKYDVAEQWVETNTIGAIPRTTVLTHQHDELNWILNLETRMQVSQGTETISERSAQYFKATDKEKSARKNESRFGLHYRSFEYQPDGTLSRLLYSTANVWIGYRDYKRGKAETVYLPNRYDTGLFSLKIQQVNDNGTTAWTSDLNGNITYYQYDQLNRLTLIDPADSRWENTIISYDTDPTGKGALTQLVRRGSYRKILTLDALMQPILSKEWDASNESASSRYVNQQFNAYGKPTFTSTTSALATETYGISTSYDGLQRVLTQTNTADGDLSYGYGADNSVVVENGRGFKTTTHYLAYGEPQTALATKILQPEGVTTLIDYNIAGLPTTIMQGGLSEIRRYDSYMNLCIQKRPDTGMKWMEHNSLGQITRYAEGVGGIGTHCNDYSMPTTSAVLLAYDNLGDLHTTTFKDNATPNQARQLDRQGNLQKLAAGSIVWDYTYTSSNQAETETLRAGGKIYSIANGYNSLGALKSQQYGGVVTEYAPNAFGQPTQVADSQFYASQVQYHPGGQLKSFNYGNGLQFSQVLDGSFKPYERTVRKGGALQHGQRYQYDASENMQTITDLVQSSQSVSLTYDGLNRLDTASGRWGAGNFDYDEMGNLTTKQLGNQYLTYSYDHSSKRLQSVTGGYSFGYDDRGNITNNGKRSFIYNRANQLTNAPYISYTYDGHGRRVLKWGGSSNAYSVYNQAGKLLLTDGPNGMVRYLYLGDELIAKSGATTALEDKPGYTGHLEDKDIGLTYMQQRYYDPVIGRFYSNDPVRFTADKPMMFNRYAYANNNPYKFIDPDGMLAEQIDIKIDIKIDVAFKGENVSISSSMTGKGEELSNEQLDKSTMQRGVEVVKDGGKTMLVMGKIGIDSSTVKTDVKTEVTKDTAGLKEGEGRAEVKISIGDKNFETKGDAVSVKDEINKNFNGAWGGN